MATMKAEQEHHPEDSATMEAERVEKELDTGEISQLCRDHCGGISATDCVGDRKATAGCQDLEDGSGGKNDKCSEVKQQADHYRSTMKKTN